MVELVVVRRVGADHGSCGRVLWLVLWLSGLCGPLAGGPVAFGVVQVGAGRAARV